VFGTLDKAHSYFLVCDANTTCKPSEEHGGVKEHGRVNAIKKSFGEIE
jgi:hypothetical protein